MIKIRTSWENIGVFKKQILAKDDIQYKVCLIISNSSSGPQNG